MSTNDQLTTVFPDGKLLTREGIGILTAAAYWLMDNKQKMVTVIKKESGFEVFISTDFSEEPIGGNGKKGVIFNAVINEDGRRIETRFLVHRIPQLPRGFGSGWEFSAFTRIFLRKNAEQATLN